MAKVAIFQDEAGGVTVTHFAPGVDPAKESARIAAGREFTLVEFDTLPASREFRGAWRKDAAGVVVDMPAARLIHMGKIRAARNAALAALDVDYLRAGETGNASEQQTIAAEKQRLRDLPESFALDGAATPQALSDLWPAGLPRP